MLEPSRGDYARILDDLSLYSFPRSVGVPKRSVVTSPASFAWWLEKLYAADPEGLVPRYEGHPVPVFIGHSAYEIPAEGRSVSANAFVFNAAFGDMDTGNGSGLRPEEVFEEAVRASHWLVERRQGHAWLWSGSDGGFHLRIFFREEHAKRDYLARWENAFWRGFKNQLSLRSINIQCAEPDRLERLPYTPYVHKKDPTSPGYKLESNYCVPIPWRWIYDGQLDRIRDLSAHPRVFESVRYEGSVPRPTLEAFVRLHGWEAFGHVVSAFHPAPTFEPKGSIADLNRLLIPDRYCLQTLPFGSNPKHHVRLAWVHEILAVGLSSGSPFSLEELTMLTDLLAEEAKWEDRINVNERHSQVGYAHARPYAFDRETGDVQGFGFGCRKLREWSVCPEDAPGKCPRFSKMFPAEYAEWLRSHPEVERKEGTE